MHFSVSGPRVIEFVHARYVVGLDISRPNSFIVVFLFFFVLVFFFYGSCYPEIK